MAALALLAATSMGSARAAPSATAQTSQAAAAPAQRQGVAVVATSEHAREPAKALARAVYAQPGLRPRFDEQVARVLVGEPARAADQDRRLSELAEVVRAVAPACSRGCEGSAVARRLLASLGRDLGAELVVAVRRKGERVTARVLRVADGRFVPVVLAPQKPAAAEGAQTEAAWSEVVPILRSLQAEAHPAAPLMPASGPSASTAEPDGEDEGGELDFLSSPWFWGGLGVVAAVGITVFALSQSGANDPDVVRLEGRVSP